MVIKPVTGLVKFVLVIIAALLLTALQTLGLVLRPIRPIHRVYHRLISAFLMRLILVFLGFFWIKHEVVTLKRGRNAASNKGQQQTSRKPSASYGELIVSNWSSYIDVLYLAFRYDPVFTQIYADTLTVREISLWEALLQSGSYPELSPPEGIETLPLSEFMKAMHKKGSGPVVIFPEGTTTNNRAILRFIPVFKNCPVPETSFQIKLVALKYEYAKFAPTFTIGLGNGTRLGHLFRTCAQFTNYLSVKSLNPLESPSNAHFSTLDGLSSNSTSGGSGQIEPVQDDDALGSVILNLLGRMTRFRKLGLSVHDKTEFLDYFILRNNGIRAKPTTSTTTTTTTSTSSSSKKTSSSARLRR
ncbi:hypothetical protein BGW38_006279 [Lunasporangiospora selenospora]|uniref:Phospholipid/glycerol acyltransferase domain-containing protein n=1 Tax=Lunasporangiospora selenospora TaxID=979761 RepID=A0A9P6G347_9FUNG|nr:hypothetical protein BGW38_006279 [Lunasporangiospora selenospora]